MARNSVSQSRGRQQSVVANGRQPFPPAATALAKGLYTTDSHTVPGNLPKTNIELTHHQSALRSMHPRLNYRIFLISILWYKQTIVVMRTVVFCDKETDSSVFADWALNLVSPTFFCDLLLGSMEWCLDFTWIRTLLWLITNNTRWVFQFKPEYTVHISIIHQHTIIRIFRSMES